MRRATALTLSGLLALASVAAAETTDGDGEVTEEVAPCTDPETGVVSFREEQVWFHETGSKLGNTEPAVWDTTPPATSVQGGAGAGAVSSAASLGDTSGQGRSEAVFTGTFAGCIDTIDLALYSFDPANRTGTSASGEPAEHNFGYVVSVDGYDVASGGPVAATTTFANEGMGPNLNEYRFDVGAAIETLAGLDLLAVDGDHEVTVRVASWYANTGHSVYLWDTTEVPSGLTFNAADETTATQATTGS